MLRAGEAIVEFEAKFKVFRSAVAGVCDVQHERTSDRRQEKLDSAIRSLVSVSEPAKRKKTLGERKLACKRFFSFRLKQQALAAPHAFNLYQYRLYSHFLSNTLTERKVVSPSYRS